MKKFLIVIFTSLLCLSIITVFSLIGCKKETVVSTTTETKSIESDTPETTVAESTVEETSVAKEPVDLKVIHFRAEDEAGITPIYDAFEQKYPWITIKEETAPTGEYPQLRMANLQSGAEGADVLMEWVGPSLYELASAGSYVDLSKYPETIKTFDIDFLRANTGVKDGIYGTLFGAGLTAVLYYNPQMLQENGINLPQNKEELYQAFDKFLSKGITPLEVGAKDQWPYVCLICILNACLVQDKDPNYWKNAKTVEGIKPFTDENGFRKIVEEIKYMVDKGYIDKNSSGLSYEDAENDFITGKNPFFIDGDWAIGELTQKDSSFKFDVGRTPFYTEEQGPVLDVSTGPCWTINAKSQHIDEAALFIAFFHENFDVYNKVAKFMPAYKNPSEEVLAGISPFTVKINKLMQESKLYPFVHSNYPAEELELESYRVVSGVASGEIAIDKGLSDLEAIWEKNFPDLYTK
jgi:raffinose/stachyose/melibiose transport system substrate-binding protein